MDSWEIEFYIVAGKDRTLYEGEKNIEFFHEGEKIEFYIGAGEDGILHEGEKKMEAGEIRFPTVEANN